jgi:hypothetical protein
MTTMNPYYARESDVGPVFDVAHYSSRKAIGTAVIGLVFGALVALAAAYVWAPDRVLAHPPKWYADAHQEAKDAIRQHPFGFHVGVGVAALFAALCVAGAASCLVNATTGNYYVRVGEGGVSLRVPDGIFSTFERDLAWSDIAKLKVVQEKQIGAMSKGSGNLGGRLELRTYDGLNKILRLDHFREDAWLIYKRIDESREMQTAVLA